MERKREKVYYHELRTLVYLINYLVLLTVQLFAFLLCRVLKQELKSDIGLYKH